LYPAFRAVWRNSKLPPSLGNLRRYDRGFADPLTLLATPLILLLAAPLILLPAKLFRLLPPQLFCCWRR